MRVVVINCVAGANLVAVMAIVSLTMVARFGWRHAHGCQRLMG